MHKRRFGEAELQFLISARKRRKLSQTDLAARVGTTRSNIANIEMGRTAAPRVELERGLLALVDAWREEDALKGNNVVRETREFYADTTCPSCQAWVPGPLQSLKCLRCGAAWPMPLCLDCKAAGNIVGSFCACCGKKL